MSKFIYFERDNEKEIESLKEELSEIMKEFPNVKSEFVAGITPQQLGLSLNKRKRDVTWKDIEEELHKKLDRCASG